MSLKITYSSHRSLKFVPIDEGLAIGEISDKTFLKLNCKFL